MLAYHIHPEGYGFKTDTDQFFWSRVSAGKYCESQLYANLLLSVKKYVEYTTNATVLGPTYNTIKRDAAFCILNQFVRAEHTQSLLQLSNSILDLEAHLRAIIPGKNHPFHFKSKEQLNDIIWMCIRIRKQFKIQT